MKQLTTVETVHEEGSWLFTVRDRHGELEEALLVPCEEGVEHGSTSSQSAVDGVEGWINRCTHEAQRFDTGQGAPIRNGQLICPRHGSMFNTCSGYCDNGEAADTTLRSVEVSVRDDGRVVLTDDGLSFVGEGGIDENEHEDDGDDDGPASTSHIGF